jgi:uncharacterized surface protein with fasciclin (FAS1) repeats
VFAPLDDAFGELPEGTVHTCKAREQGTIVLLTYHVLAGKVLSTDLSDGMKATTVNGQEVTVHLKEGKVFINDAEVVLLMY